MKTLVKTILTRIALYEMMEADEILYQYYLIMERVRVYRKNICSIFIEQDIIAHKICFQ